MLELDTPSIGPANGFIARWLTSPGAARYVRPTPSSWKITAPELAAGTAAAPASATHATSAIRLMLLPLVWRAELDYCTQATSSGGRKSIPAGRLGRVSEKRHAPASGALRDAAHLAPRGGDDAARELPAIGQAVEGLERATRGTCLDEREEAVVAQDTHVVGQGAETDLQPLLQLARAQRVVPERDQRPQADRMAEEPEDVGQRSHSRVRGKRHVRRRRGLARGS